MTYCRRVGRVGPINVASLPPVELPALPVNIGMISCPWIVWIVGSVRTVRTGMSAVAVAYILCFAALLRQFRPYIQVEL